MLKKLSLLLSVMLLWSPPSYSQKGDFMSVPEFAEQVFGDISPWQTLWLNNDQKSQLSDALNRPFRQLRLRYMQEGETTLWIFDEIGKELPITIGLAVNDQGIAALQILTYRESRGGEVRMAAFREQFLGASLMEDELDQPIDGITGATMSVWTVKRAATAALLCHQWVRGNAR
jgi:hypothetical protein